MGIGGRRRASAGAGFVLGAALVAGLLVQPAAAAESCAYNAGTKAVTASIAAGGQATLVVVGGALHFGATPTACGAATTSNTDSISITGNAGTSERLVLDHRGGVFGPGFTPEFNTPEIEIATSLGDSTDRVVVYATEGNDVMAPGQDGMALNTDGDVDVTFSPGIFQIEAHMLGGNDYFNGRGQGGAGLHFLGPITLTGGDGNDTLLRGSSDPDVIDGGPGNDDIQGQEGSDVITAGSGNDSVAGGSENDTLTGDAGLDSFAGSTGDDIIHAQDDEADTLINGGPGIDTAYYDEQVDANPVAVENRIGDGGPPPPPGGTCSYNSGTRAVAASIPSGTQATLKVVGGQIWYGATPAACGAATTTNTDTISIAGNAGTVETLVVDMSGGAFAPGATAESTGIAEIELNTSLGEYERCGRRARNVRSRHDPDRPERRRVELRQRRDVTFAPLPAQIEVLGNGGVNTLSARGGFGTGSIFLGKAILRAGSAGDLVQGGAGNDGSSVAPVTIESRGTTATTRSTGPAATMSCWVRAGTTR